jgi:hypothetical protein
MSGSAALWRISADGVICGLGGGQRRPVRRLQADHLAGPAGTGEDLIGAIGHQFDREYGVVLRAVLFAVDRHLARQVTGIPGMKRQP